MTASCSLRGVRRALRHHDARGHRGRGAPSGFSRHAAFADESRGREREIPLDPYRTEFQRDRDRIIHCKAFRRLSHKTQVFLAPEGDHYRTRMTHTLEVSQIARSIARALRLNEDLAEAIALGHDLGHTPFGHTGESALDEALRALMPRGAPTRPGTGTTCSRCESSSSSSTKGKGLNLTWEVRDGILGHTGRAVPATLEGQIVRIADRIAYVNHDIDDAVRAGVLTEADLPAGPLAVLGPHPARESPRWSTTWCSPLPVPTPSACRRQSGTR